MGTFRQEYTELADAIITNAIVVPADVEAPDGQSPVLYYYTDNAAWDTGAQFILFRPA